MTGQSTERTFEPTAQTTSNVARRTSAPPVLRSSMNRNRMCKIQPRLRSTFSKCPASFATALSLVASEQSLRPNGVSVRWRPLCGPTEIVSDVSIHRNIHMTKVRVEVILSIQRRRPSTLAEKVRLLQRCWTRAPVVRAGARRPCADRIVREFRDQKFQVKSTLN